MADAYDPLDLPARLDALEAAVRARTDLVPRLGIVLGSGLGGLAARVESPLVIPFADLPGWPAASAPGHAGRLLLGSIGGVPVVCLQGRLHIYEGHPPGLVVQPVLLMGRLGAPRILLTNAAGGVNVAWPPGTLMALTDHLNLTGLNPLLGTNPDELGPRFPDLTDAWDPDLRARLHEAARVDGIRLEEGVYAGLLGPNYETPAEVRMLRTLGADAVGMSTVAEVLAARALGLRCLGISTVTNLASGIGHRALSHAEVMETARAVQRDMVSLFKGIIEKLKTDD
jgi:purine-nucleoside phosphorylase